MTDGYRRGDARNSTFKMVDSHGRAPSPGTGEAPSPRTGARTKSARQNGWRIGVTRLRPC